MKKLKTKIIKKKEISELNIQKGVVVCGDIHLHNAYPYNDNSNIISSRLEDISRALNEVGNAAMLLDLPIVLNGDIITSGIFDFPVEHVLTEFLIKYNNIPMYINLGNHDFDGVSSVMTPLIKYGRNEIHSVIDKPTKFSFDYFDPKLNFFFAPYQRKLDAMKSLTKISKNLKANETNVLFIHNQFIGSSYANKTKGKSGLSQRYFVSGNFSKYNIIIASHIHKFQSICGGKGIYTSSLIPINFGERKKEHGYHIIDFDKYVDYFIIPRAPNFKYIKYNQLSEYDADQLKKKVKGNIVCIKKDKDQIIDKKKITNNLIDIGARFVTFKNILSNRKEEELHIDESENLEAIVASYSKIISEKNPKLKFKKIENIGLEILQEAKQSLHKIMEGAK